MPSEDVIKAFKKFDKDGNGVISRSELSMVLKNLSDTWDDDSVERLMNKADKNGDGVLQIEEFVNWLFAALEVDPTLKDAANLVASCPEEQGRMIGELFAFFDIDSDRYWNFKEADYSVVATEGKHLDEFSWKQMLHVAPPEFVDKGKQALSLEGMVWYYLNPEFEFNIEKDYLSVFTKVKMVQELFDFFDLDKDGYWNFTESCECSFATDESAGQNHTEEMFAWLVNELMPADEKSKGLSRKCVVDVYCQPMHSRFEMNIAKDHEALQVYKESPQGYSLSELASIALLLQRLVMKEIRITFKVAWRLRNHSASAELTWEELHAVFCAALAVAHDWDQVIINLESLKRGAPAVFHERFRIGQEFATGHVKSWRNIRKFVTKLSRKSLRPAPFYSFKTALPTYLALYMGYGNYQNFDCCRCGRRPGAVLRSWRRRGAGHFAGPSVGQRRGEARPWSVVSRRAFADAASPGGEPSQLEMFNDRHP